MTETFHMLKMKNRYLTMKPPRNSTMYLSFKTRKQANKCKAFIEHFRDTHGSWPNLNMDSVHEKIIETETASIKEPLCVVEKSLKEIESLMHCSGAGVIYCHSFMVIPYGQTQTINFSAQEMGVPMVDIVRYTNCLEDILHSSEDN